MYFVANWKMYGNLKSLNTLNKVIKFSKSKEIKKGRLIYCPPYTLITSFFKKFENCLIDIGGQNCHENEDYGAHTGFVNPRMLKSIGANYVILGHSENRAKGETDKLINLKIRSAIKAKLKVIFCIGETLKEKNSGKTNSILSKLFLGCQGPGSINSIGIILYFPFTFSSLRIDFFSNSLPNKLDKPLPKPIFFTALFFFILVFLLIYNFTCQRCISL